MCKSNYEERHSRNLQKVNISPKQKDSLHFGIVWIKKKKKKTQVQCNIYLPYKNHASLKPLNRLSQELAWDFLTDEESFKGKYFVKYVMSFKRFFNQKNNRFSMYTCPIKTR